MSLRDPKTVSSKNKKRVAIGKFDAIVVAGGQSPMFTLESAIDVHRFNRPIAGGPQ